MNTQKREQEISHIFQKCSNFTYYWLHLSCNDLQGRTLFILLSKYVSLLNDLICWEHCDKFCCHMHTFWLLTVFIKVKIYTPQSFYIIENQIISAVLHLICNFPLYRTLVSKIHSGIGKCNGICISLMHKIYFFLFFIFSFSFSFILIKVDVRLQNQSPQADSPIHSIYGSKLNTIGKLITCFYLLKANHHFITLIS